METNWRDHWLDVARRWEVGLADLGLDGLIPALKPLGPAAAHLLWIAGPMLGAARRGGAVGALAEVLYAAGDASERRNMTTLRESTGSPVVPQEPLLNPPLARGGKTEQSTIARSGGVPGPNNDQRLGDRGSR